MAQLLQLGKFDGTDFQYDNTFLTFITPKYPIKEFRVPNLGIFVFLQNFTIRQTREC